MTDSKKYLLALTAAALAVRTLYILHSGNSLTYPDERVFHGIALNLLSDPWTPGLFGNREPLYPLFIALVYKLAGVNPVAVKMLQAVFSLATLYFIYKTAQRLFGEATARLGLLAAAFYPQFIFYDAYLLRESLMVFFTSAIIYYSDRSLGGGTKELCLAGLLTGLAVLTKSIYLFYWPLFLAAGLLLGKARLKAAFAATLVLLATVLPAALRNRAETGDFFLTRGQNLNLYLTLVIPKEAHGSSRENEIFNLLPVYTEGMKLPPKEQDRYFLRKTVEEAAARPGNFLDMTAWRFLKLWRLYPYPGMEYAHNWYLLLLISLLTDGWLIPLGVWGAFSLRKRYRELYPVYICLASFTLIYSLSWSQIRYRLPLMPLVILLAAPLLAKAADRLMPELFKEDPEKC